MKRQSVSSGTTMEATYGYCRAIRVGDRILVAGTTATDAADTIVGIGDPAAQTEFIIDKIARAIEQLGGVLGDVVRTRIYVSDVAHWEPVALVHGARFGDIRPVNTFVEARLIGDQYLVEIEAEALVGSADAL